MERAGYLGRSRDTVDRRKVWIEPTDRTREMNRHIWGHLAIVLPPLFERFTVEEMHAIADYLEIGTYINRQRAALLQDHLVGQGATQEERMAEATAFEAEAEKLATCIGDQIRRGESPRDFADPEERE